MSPEGYTGCKCHVDCQIMKVYEPQTLKRNAFSVFGSIGLSTLIPQSLSVFLHLIGTITNPVL
jgi:hypothetical protein